MAKYWDPVLVKILSPNASSNLIYTNVPIVLVKGLFSKLPINYSIA